MTRASRATVDAAPLCVIGRSDFTTGIGAVAYGAAELFSRTIGTCFFDVTGRCSSAGAVVLPNGRSVPICTREGLAAKKVLVFTDVLWNGGSDRKYQLVPSDGDVFRVAHIAWDSDRLPPEWVEILNRRFDAVLVSSPHLERVAGDSGVTITIGTLPIGLDIEGLLARPFLPWARGAKVRFGVTASFHPRKGVLQLLEAFANEFGDSPQAELLIHSNLAVGDTFAAAKAFLGDRGLSNVLLSHSTLQPAELDTLHESFHVYCSCSTGEGYSIGPRQALALGKPLVLSAIGPHHELLTAPGVFPVHPVADTPAVYPEIDNRVFGAQQVFRIDDIRRALRAAFHFCSTDKAARTAGERKEKAACYSFSALQGPYAAVALGRQQAAVAIRTSNDAVIHLPARLTSRGEAVLGRFRSRLGGTYRTVVPCRDAGFFSVFNTFFSHLVWDAHDPRCVGIFPDWRVERLLRQLGSKMPVSFCYGTQEDGNLWLSFFEPLFGATREEMNSSDFLEQNAQPPREECNERREPLLTYKNADALYRESWFPQFRCLYHRYFDRHVRLLPHLRNEVDRFCAPFEGRLMLAAHVKHPSHVIEQAGNTIAGVPDYIASIAAILRQRGISESADDWGLFLATDRDAVVDEFIERFGGHVFVHRDVRRTTRQDDARFAALTPEQQRLEGHMIQHLVAADTSKWSTRMAWEVIRDAYAMARCDMLLHVVSNISTAVSYMNPQVTLVHIDGNSATRW